MICRSWAALTAFALLGAGCGGSGQQAAPATGTDTVTSVPGTVGSVAGTSDAAAAAAATEGPAATTPTPAGQGAAQAAPPVIVDVRTQQEYDAGHVDGAILIPHDQMEQRWQELAQYRDQPVVLYCRSGRRSGIALEVLKSKGFTQLENGGGLGDMAGKGYRVTK